MAGGRGPEHDQGLGQGQGQGLETRHNAFTDQNNNSNNGKLSADDDDAHFAMLSSAFGDESHAASLAVTERQRRRARLRRRDLFRCGLGLLGGSGQKRDSDAEKDRLAMLILSILDVVSEVDASSSSSSSSSSSGIQETERRNFSGQNQSLSVLLTSTFSVLDTDSDGYLTAADFSAVEPTYEDLKSQVDPTILYAATAATPSGGIGGTDNQDGSILTQSDSPHRHHDNDNNANNTVERSISHISALTIPEGAEDAEEEDNDEDDAVDVPPGPVLHKVDSLWHSLSHEKMQPPSAAAQRSRSVAGWEGTSDELATLVHSIRQVHTLTIPLHHIVILFCYCHWFSRLIHDFIHFFPFQIQIVDESAHTTAALLLHYGWDAKSLIEDYLENRKAVRARAGLGPRTMPPFLRRDIFSRPGNNNNGSSGHSSTVKFASLPSTLQGSGDTTRANTITNETTPPISNDEVECGICLDSVPPHEAYALTCEHWFCADCWRGYLRNAVGGGASGGISGESPQCPQAKCCMRVPLDLPEVLGPPELYQGTLTLNPNLKLS